MAIRPCDRDRYPKNCQRCHLLYDRGQRLRYARETRLRRLDAARPLLRVMEDCS